MYQSLAVWCLFPHVLHHPYLGLVPQVRVDFLVLAVCSCLFGFHWEFAGQVQDDYMVVGLIDTALVTNHFALFICEFA